MSNSKKKWVGVVSLSSLLALAMAAGVGSLTRDAAAAPDWVTNAAIQSINTDSKGVIIDIGYKVLNSPRSLNGCGAKIQDLPNLLEAQRVGLAELKTENNFLKGIRTRR
jgi:hypothetical protein